VYTLAQVYKNLEKATAKIQGQQPKTIWQSLSNAVPIAQEQSVMLQHNYDGIQELDNHLPPWWTGLFVLTIIFAVFYAATYHLWDAPLQKAEYDTEMRQAQLEIDAFEAKNIAEIDENSAKLMLDQTKVIALGTEIYTGKCAACHGTYAEGLVGPNLTDAYWLHGNGSIKDIFKVIKNGVPEKGMIAWKTSLKPNEIEAVSNYLILLKDSKPANAKEPQGTLAP
jgi:cytochrome c oxidase cbb3-type subunit III